jgi:hypothetical protein
MLLFYYYFPRLYIHSESQLNAIQAVDSPHIKNTTVINPSNGNSNTNGTAGVRVIVITITRPRTTSTTVPPPEPSQSSLLIVNSTLNGTVDSNGDATSSASDIVQNTISQSSTRATATQSGMNSPSRSTSSLHSPSSTAGSVDRQLGIRDPQINNKRPPATQSQQPQQQQPPPHKPNNTTTNSTLPSNSTATPEDASNSTTYVYQYVDPFSDGSAGDSADTTTNLKASSLKPLTVAQISSTLNVLAQNKTDVRNLVQWFWLPVLVLWMYSFTVYGMFPL